MVLFQVICGILLRAPKMNLPSFGFLVTELVAEVRTGLQPYRAFDT